MSIYQGVDYENRVFETPRGIISLVIVRQTPKFVIGIDEVGRGPIAGPVAVCAFLWKDRETLPPYGIKDSKKLSPQKREEWFRQVQIWKRESRVTYAVSFVSAQTIDRIGITKSITRALVESLRKLQIEPENVLVLLDGGLRAPHEFHMQKTIIRGDEKEPVIALASIVAKVLRDKMMERFAMKYPLYGFEEHKGYGTHTHYRAIKKHGMSPLHRVSFLQNH